MVNCFQIYGIKVGETSKCSCSGLTRIIGLTIEDSCCRGLGPEGFAGGFLARFAASSCG